MKITNETIPLIEKALGFELYEWQRAYLLDEIYVKPTERATGRTTAYIVKLLLTNREPINIKFDAMKYKDYHTVHYTGFFRNFMREIDEKLTVVGLPTCSVKPKPIRGITIDLGVDTNKMQLKLRAIAKHTEALADELDAIDNAWQCPNCDESNYDDYFAGKAFKHRVCNACNTFYDGQDITDDDLPTRLEGSD